MSLRRFFRRRQWDQERVRELESHLSHEIDDNIARGMTPEEARRRAYVKFGNPSRIREEIWQMNSFSFLENLARDVRYAVRQLRKSPGFTITVILTLALGIGANTAIFSAVQATLLRTLPYPHADQIISIQDSRLQGQSTGGLVSVPRFFDLQSQNNSFAALALFYFENPTLIAGSRLPESLNGVGASGQFWRVFGAQPLLGRTFNDRDDRKNSPNIAVLSYGAWQRLFGGNPDAIGRQVTIERKATTIIGVMPSGFDYPHGTDIWQPSHFDPADWGKYRGDGTRSMNVFARLKPNVSLQAAQNNLRVISSRLQQDYPATDASWQFSSQSLRDYLSGRFRPALLVLLIASGTLLLIACINVANLLLSRASARQREIALRRTLGATSRRILSQFFIESLLLTFFGGGVGLLTAMGLVHAIESHLPGGLNTVRAGVDRPVILFALALCILTGIVFGIVPAWHCRSIDLSTTLKEGEPRIAGRSGRRLRSAFLSIQTGLSLVLLVGALLLVQSLWKLTRSPLGFQPEHVLTFQIALPRTADANASRNFYSELQRRIESLPGVTSVGQISALPTDDWHARSNYDIDGRPRTANHDTAAAEDRYISGDILRAIHIPLLAGRELTPRDQELKSPPVLVNRQFAHEYFPNENPIGKHLIDGTEQFEIVGVIGNVRGTAGSIANAISPEVYFPEQGSTRRLFAVRTHIPPEQIVSAIQGQVHQIDPQQAIGKVRTLDDMLNASVVQPRLNTGLVVAFACIALLLACVGIYGVVAYSVAQRTREIGLRMAVGASRGQVAWLFIRQSAISTGFGMAGGLLATFLTIHLLRSLLYGVEPYDMPTILAALLVLFLPSVLATLIPARRAASVDPMQALRAE
jgi:putative ABC transport system permease protein